LSDTAVSRQDLFKACESLFGTDIDVSVEFLRYLKPAGVKAAYRKKAMETHPDRAVVTSGNSDFLADRFKEVSVAYQLLLEFMAAPWKYSLDEKGALYQRRQTHRRADQSPSARSGFRPRAKSATFTQPRQAKPRTPAEPLYSGRMPTRRLLLGQYLYYSGSISLSQLIKAIVWQRLHRPSVGAIAVSWDWLTGPDVLAILRSRKYGEKFGECAIRLGYLSRYQLTRILEKQKTTQPRIGKYFLDERLLTSGDLFKLVVEMKMHNKKYWM